MNDFGYDIECYPNVFTLTCTRIETNEWWYYEISERTNDIHGLIHFLNFLRDINARMVGFNNIGYDYVVIHYIIENAPVLLKMNSGVINEMVYNKSQSIFQTDNRFAHIIWQPYIKQLDLFRIHHFDNKAKSTSLKALEYNMRSVSIEDLPFEPGYPVPLNGLDKLKKYNGHDVKETVRFYGYSLPMIRFRDELSNKYGIDFTNYNDTKIGKEYFIMKLEEHSPGTCYYRDSFGKRKPRQTNRINGVKLSEIIFPYVKFNHPEFNRILTWMKQQILSAKEIENSLVYGVNTKGVFKDVNCVINGLKYDFGTGGIHGSVNGESIHADDYYDLVDVDVASYYPNLAIANRLFPEHLGELFCDIYKDVYEQRKTFSKKTAENAMLKLALNGVYGDSNQIFSPFYDPQYTMSITINGQLLLCMLAELFFNIPDLTIIQINTDGMTVKIPKQNREALTYYINEWEKLTGLELEAVDYKSMFIRDVNNYVGVYKDGSIKTKGAYETKLPQDRNPLGWHQNISALVVPKAAVEYLTNGTPINEYITSRERDIMDFMLRVKVNRTATLYSVDDNGNEVKQQRVTRYFVARDGVTLIKKSPPPKPFEPGMYKKAAGISNEQYMSWFKANGNVYNPELHTKNQSVYADRKDGVTVGWKVEICNDIRYCNWFNINYEYYINEANKLVDCLK